MHILMFITVALQQFIYTHIHTHTKTEDEKNLKLLDIFSLQTVNNQRM